MERAAPRFLQCEQAFIVFRIGLDRPAQDIKPNNLYFLKGEWLLADFGIASFPGKAALTQNGRKLGPVCYIAPEMLNSPKTADGKAADVYSFAKTIWVLLSGQAFPLPERFAVDVRETGSQQPGHAGCFKKVQRVLNVVGDATV